MITTLQLFTKYHVTYMTTNMRIISFGNKRNRNVLTTYPFYLYSVHRFTPVISFLCVSFIVSFVACTVVILYSIKVL